MEEDMTRQIPRCRMIHEEITASWAIEENGDEYQEENTKKRNKFNNVLCLSQNKL